MKENLKTRLKHFDRFGLLRVGCALAGTRGVTIVTGIALSVLLARYLSVDGYGNYLFALTIAQILAMPVLMGLPTLVVRQIAIYRANEDEAHLRGIIYWSLRFTAFTLTIVVVAFGLYLSVSGRLEVGLDEVILLHLLALPLVGALAFMRLTGAILQGFDRPFWATLPDSGIRPVLLLAFVLGAIGLGALTPVWAMILHITATTAALGWAVAMAMHQCNFDISEQAQAPKSETRSWLSSLMPLGLIAAAAVINTRLDIFMIGILANPQDVAFYGLAAQIAGLGLIGQTIMNTIIAPRIAHFHNQGDRLTLQRMTRNAARLATLASVLVFFVIVLAGEEILTNLVGVEYAGAAWIAFILATGFVISAALGPVALSLNMTGYERITARIVWISAGMNAVLNAVAIPLYGAQGAAMTSVTCLVLSQVAMKIWLFRKLKLTTAAVGGSVSAHPCETGINQSF